MLISTGEKDPIIKIWNIYSGLLINNLYEQGLTSNVVITKNGKYMISATYYLEMNICNVKKEKIFSTFFIGH